MQHTLKTESGEYEIRSCPASTRFIRKVDGGIMYDHTEGCEIGCSKSVFIGGNWEIIGLYPGLSEEQMAGILDEDKDCIGYVDYRNSFNYFHKASESFASLLEANRIYEVNPLGDEISQWQNYGKSDQYLTSEESYNKWQEAEECTSKFKLILKKL